MNNLTWNEIQEQSDLVLSCGLNKLSTQPFFDSASITERESGNYLISLDKVPFYIGEGKVLAKRLKQQFSPATSTFYKTFQKVLSSNMPVRRAGIGDFRVQVMPTNIGRKEVEEFGIVNLPTKLNSFQMGKRSKCIIADQNGLWNKVQQNALRILQEGEDQALQLSFSPWFNVRIEDRAGLYLVKDKADSLIYVGESSNVGERILVHGARIYFSALRRNIGRDIFGFTLQVVNGKKRYFSISEDNLVTAFLSSCKVSIFPVTLGRYELEEYLIKKYRPLLNRKGASLYI